MPWNKHRMLWQVERSDALIQYSHRGSQYVSIRHTGCLVKAEANYRRFAANTVEATSLKPINLPGPRVVHPVVFL